MDMREKTMKELNTLITQVGKKGKEREEVINDLAKIAIWHSIKDGQITPAAKLYGALCRGDNKQGIVAFMAEHGNIAFGKLKGEKVKGIIYIKHPHNMAEKVECDDKVEQIKQQSLAQLALANNVYENLPDFWEEHAAPEPIIKDYDVHAAFVRLSKEVRARIEAGKQALTKDDKEKKLLDNILLLFPKAA